VVLSLQDARSHGEVMKRNIRFTECSLWLGLSTCIRKATAVLAQATLQTIFARRELARLADLDDRMLADIGLTRSDLLVAGSAPLWQNPTSILEQRVGSRRADIFPGAPADPPSV